MHIAHVGTSMSLGQIVLNQLVFQRQKGHDVTAMCPDEEWTEVIRAHGIRVIVVPFYRHNLLATLVAVAHMRNICRREHFDVVHTHNSLPGMAGRIAARLARVPAIVHTCHAWPLHQPRSRLFFWMYRVMEMLATRAGDATLFQNPDDMRSCIELKVVPPHKASLFGNGIDIPRFMAKANAQDRLKIREEFEIGHDAFVLAYVARLERPKGHAFFLQGLRRLIAHANRQVVALLVGTGKHEKEIRAEVEHLGLQPFVHFTGYRNDIPNILQAADLSVLTSQFEGVPRALMESMALGLPVVGTDVPGTRTLVESGTTGLLVRYGDVEALVGSLIQVMENPEMAKRLGLGGKHLVRTKFVERVVADRVLQVYDYVLQGKQGPLPDWAPEGLTKDLD